MSDDLKIQKLKIIIIEIIYQKLKVCYFCYMICERQLEDNSGRFLCIVKVTPSYLWCFEFHPLLNATEGAGDKDTHWGQALPETVGATTLVTQTLHWSILQTAPRRA